MRLTRLLFTPVFWCAVSAQIDPRRAGHARRGRAHRQPGRAAADAFRGHRHGSKNARLRLGAGMAASLELRDADARRFERAGARPEAARARAPAGSSAHGRPAARGRTYETLLGDADVATRRPRSNAGARNDPDGCVGGRLAFHRLVRRAGRGGARHRNARGARSRLLAHRPAARHYRPTRCRRPLPGEQFRDITAPP